MGVQVWAVVSVTWMVGACFLELRPTSNTMIDASVTQSALEEALASNMQHGGMASRMSSISQALRSKYL